MLLRDPSFQKLCRARDLLCDEQEQAPTIEAVARAVGISQFHFIRQFEAVFGETPHQFRIRMRLERAKQLLVSGDHSVTEVCMELGFSSLGSFSTMFARRVGETPSGYRRRKRTLVAVPAVLPWESVPGCFGLMTGLPAGVWLR